MKTLSRTLRLIVWAVIVTLVVVGCCNYVFVVPDTQARAFVELGHGRVERTYVPWKSQNKFDKALAQVRHHGGKICVCVLLPGGTPYPHELNNDCKDYRCPSPENIRTVKVLKSKAADTIAGESAVNDPHATYKVQSAYPGDIVQVLDALEHN
jgi:hypothetical protein